MSGRERFDAGRFGDGENLAEDPLTVRPEFGLGVLSAEAGDARRVEIPNERRNLRERSQPSTKAANGETIEI